MKKIIRLTESDLMRIVKKVLNEQQNIGGGSDAYYMSKLKSQGEDKKLLEQVCLSWNSGTFDNNRKKKIESWTKKYTGTMYPIRVDYLCKDQKSTLNNLTDSQRKILKGIRDLEWM